MLAAAYIGGAIASFVAAVVFMLRGGLIYTTILNSVNGHPQTERKFPIMFGNMHVPDVIKGYRRLFPNSDLLRRMYRNQAIGFSLAGVAVLLLFHSAKAGA